MDEGSRPADLGDGPPPDPGPCPVVALGHDAGIYHFLSAEGQHRVVEDRGLTAPRIMGLFGTKAPWLSAAFPSRDAVFDVGRAQRRLIMDAHAAGLFDPRDRIRGIGTWRGPDGELVVHCGDALWHAGAWHGAGSRIGGRAYTAWPAVNRPAMGRGGLLAPASADEVAEIYDFLGGWVWREPLHARRLWLGWLGSAATAGALRWRPQLWVGGPSGSGKSTLQKFVRALLGEVALTFSATTEAYVRQKLGECARPAIGDEIEGENIARARAMAELMRLAADDGQSSVGRGGAAGKAIEFPVRASFYCTSVLRVRLRPQDLSRICVLSLARLPKGAAVDGSPVADGMRRDFDRLARLGPALLARAVAGWSRFRLNQAVFEEAMAGLGQRPRNADQLGTLLAWAETLLSDQVIGAAAAEALVRAFDVDAITGDPEDEEEREMLRHLLTQEIAIPHGNGGTQRTTVSEQVMIAFSKRLGDADQVLRRHGLAVEWLKSAQGRRLGLGLALANDHQGLERLFAGTRWADTGWTQVVRDLPGADVARNGKGEPDKIYFAGARVRGWIVPLPALDLAEKELRPGDDDEVGTPVGTPGGNTQGPDG